MYTYSCPPPPVGDPPALFRFLRAADDSDEVEDADPVLSGHAGARYDEPADLESTGTSSSGPSAVVGAGGDANRDLAYAIMSSSYLAVRSFNCGAMWRSHSRVTWGMGQD
jgi:hypothetical protein